MNLYIKIVEKNRGKSGKPNKTYIVIEATVFMAEHIKISEGIVRGKVLELDKELWEDISHGLHKFVHEFVHLLVEKKTRINETWH